MILTLRSVVLLTSFTCPALMAGTIQNTSAPIGMVLQSQGQTFVQRGANRDGAVLAALLQPGDQVITAPGEVTFLFCPSSEMVTLKGETSVQLTAGGLNVLQGAPPVKEKVGGCALPSVALGAESLERVGALHGRGLYESAGSEHPPVPLYLGGPITRSRPIFQWEAIENADSYHLTLKDEKGAVVWERTTASERAVYPQSEPRLEEQRIYVWEVQARKKEDALETFTKLFKKITGESQDAAILAQASANFSVKSNPDLATRPVNDPASALMWAMELEGQSYFAEAADYFRELRKSHPEDARLTRHLAWLYSSAGLTAAADQERQRLESLQ